MQKIYNPYTDRALTRLIILATFLGLFHHIDHIIRGNHVGWPLISEVTPFTYSLTIYPLIILGIFLRSYKKGGYVYWLFLSLIGFILVAYTHISPWAVEPLKDITAPYTNTFAKILAIGILLGLLLVLFINFLYTLIRLVHICQHSQSQQK